MLGTSVLIENLHSLQARLHPIITSLAEELGDTVHVAVLEGSHIVHIARAFPSHGLNVSAEIGSKELAHVTALGKALLATLSESEIRKIYNTEALIGRTPASITRRSNLLSELQKIRMRGYATDREEARAGVTCVAAPVFDTAGQALVAISMTTATASIDAKRTPAAASQVRAAAADATESIGGRPPENWFPAET
jgi:DNA-binding IclR family transcriptional regulator